jgi:RNA polymerase sigma factor (sigma-70 family)
MEVSALKYSGGIGLHGRSRLLRLQSDERLIGYLRKGNTAAFEIVFARYEQRLLAFCRHLLGSREDAEDVLQEVMTAAFNAILADERPINVRPWLYRIARNRSLNHLRRIQAIGVDSMDLHFSDNGASTADKVHEREEFRLLVGDIHELPETQKTALVLREMDAMSYEQIAEAMETTVASVKSLLVRARVSLAEASEARLLSCDEVRIELGELAEGLRRRPSPLVRRHLRDCKRCTVFRSQLKQTNKALAALMPIGPLVILKKLALAHLGHSAGAGAGSGATAAGTSAGGAAAGGAAAGGAAAGGAAVAGSSIAVGSGGFISAGLGALATKAAAGLAAAALVTAGAVEVDHSATRVVHHPTAVAAVQHSSSPAQQASLTPVETNAERRSGAKSRRLSRDAAARKAKAAAAAKANAANAAKTAASSSSKTPKATVNTPTNSKVSPSGRTQTQTDPTVLPPTGTPITPTPTGEPTAGPTEGTPTAGTPTTPPPTTTPTPTAPTPTTPPPTTPPPTTPPPTTPPPTTGPPTPPPTTGPGTPPGQTPPVSTPPTASPPHTEPPLRTAPLTPGLVR